MSHAWPLLLLLLALPSSAQTPDAWSVALSAYQEKRYEQALVLLQPLAQQGNAEAQFFLGVIYCEGLGVASDCLTGARWYWRAALQGHDYAQYNLGALHSIGQGLPKDPSAAVHWWKKAAALGLAKAQFNLGLAYLEAQGVPQDAEQAEQWWLSAAEQGYVPAQYNLAVLYQQGLKGEPDLARARHWFSQAAAKGDAGARAALAQLDAAPPANAAVAPPARTATTPTAKPQAVTTQARTQQTPAAKTAATPAAKPTPGTSPDAAWVRKQPAGNFTVQVATEPDLKRAQAFALSYKLKTARYVQLTTGKQSAYAVLLGSYPNQAVAAAALRKLPQALQQRKPWLRRLGDLHKQVAD